MTDYVALRLLGLGAVLGLLCRFSWGGALWGVVAALIVGAYAIHYERQRLAKANAVVSKR